MTDRTILVEIEIEDSVRDISMNVLLIEEMVRGGLKGMADVAPVIEIELTN